MKKIINSKILNIIVDILSLFFSISLILSFTHIPILSIGSIILVEIPKIFIVTFIILLLSLGQFILKKTKLKKIILFSSIVSFICSSIFLILVINVSYKEKIKLNYIEALKIPYKKVNADIEINKYTSFKNKNYGLSIWKPKNNKKSPIFVYVHGGAWSSKDRFNYRDMEHCKWFSEHNFLAVNIDYPISDNINHNWKDQEKIVAKAILWIKENAYKYKGDYNRIYLAGSSAGANIILNVATKINDGTFDKELNTNFPKIKAISSLYGAPSPEDIWNNSDLTFKYWLRSSLTKHFNGSPKQYPNRYKYINTKEIINKNTPYTLWIYGTNDHFVSTRSTKEIFEKFEENNIKYKVIEFPFLDHSLDIPNSIPNQVWEQKTLEWFNKYN